MRFWTLELDKIQSLLIFYNLIVLSLVLVRDAASFWNLLTTPSTQRSVSKQLMNWPSVRNWDDSRNRSEIMLTLHLSDNNYTHSFNIHSTFTSRQPFFWCDSSVKLLWMFLRSIPVLAWVLLSQRTAYDWISVSLSCFVVRMTDTVCLSCCLWSRLALKWVENPDSVVWVTPSLSSQSCFRSVQIVTWQVLFCGICVDKLYIRAFVGLHKISSISSG